MNEDQKAVLTAVFDTFTAPLTDEETEKLVKKHGKNPSHCEAIRAYCKRTASSMGVDEKAIETITTRLNPDARQKLMQVIDLLASANGNLLLTGHWRPFYELSAKERQEALLGLATSRFEAKRAIFKGFKGLTFSTFYGMVPSTPSAVPRINANWAALQYIGPDPQRNSEKFTEKKIFEFDIPEFSADTELQMDVVIVGSGAGGGLVAGHLAKAGHRVLVLDKGPYIRQRDLTLLEEDAFPQMYESGALLSTDDGAMSILAGQTLGGGTTVNWCCSLLPPYYVREEWAQSYGLKEFASKRFTDALEAISKRANIHGGDTVVHNKQNQILIDGCKALGYPVRVAPQNTLGDHDCGWCSMGCKYADKQGTLVTWLVDAAKNGAQVIDQCFVEEVTRDEKTGQATGVIAKLKSGHKLTVKSSVVVVAGGALNTPLILQRSGLSNWHIGRNLRLHPVTGVFGVFDQQINAYQGPLMTVVSEVAADPEGDHYGAKLECPSVHPALGSAGGGWTSAFDHRDKTLDFTHIASIIVLVRDKGSGQVYAGSDGGVRVHYRMNDKDKRSMKYGLRRAAKILVAAGAKKVGVGIQGVGDFVVEDQDYKNASNNSKLEEWLDQVCDIGIVVNRTGLFSAHQMGTAKMGISPHTGATSPEGECWESKNLYVADTSLFPTPSGVNPMVTCFAMAHMVADNVDSRLTSIKTLKSKL